MFVNHVPGTIFRTSPTPSRISPGPDNPSPGNFLSPISASWSSQLLGIKIYVCPINTLACILFVTAAQECVCICDVVVKLSWIWRQSLLCRVLNVFDTCGLCCLYIGRDLSEMNQLSNTAFSRNVIRLGYAKLSYIVT